MKRFTLLAVSTVLVWTGMTGLAHAYYSPKEPVIQQEVRTRAEIHDIRTERRHERRQHRLATRERKAAQEAVRKALSQVGSNYVWGGSSPGGFDCSGLVMWSWGGLPHNADAQLSVVSAHGNLVHSNFKPGMLVFYGYGSSASHVGLYIGKGKIVNALNSNTGVVVQPVSAEYVGSPIIGAGFPR